MGKKKSKRTVHRPEFENDKPDYAADFIKVQKEAKKPVKSEDTILMEEHLSKQTMSKLAKLKADMAEAEKTAHINASKGRGAGVRNSGTQSEVKRAGQKTQEAEPDRDKSFAELFDPQDETDESFAELFKDSKLDWRSYK
ncbi:hypothetical protein LLE49_15145 [Alicyclobacillus tolerans]|uniref:hypothetical protein n=1 Tax=Alicyclobacillus tolerans TaxID=90970 RepID=UPI001F16AD5F|nr:hypothetical protein [Alicyclobacillus tolerans]MCF8566060.1 hypothetical protein [Alicyclobacillus tolerans]